MHVIVGDAIRAVVTCSCVVRARFSFLHVSIDPHPVWVGSTTCAFGGSNGWVALWNDHSNSLALVFALFVGHCVAITICRVAWGVIRPVTIWSRVANRNSDTIVRKGASAVLVGPCTHSSYIGWAPFSGSYNSLVSGGQALCCALFSILDRGPTAIPGFDRRHEND